MRKPIAVLISDIHYNIQTLEVADKALRMAVDKANALGVELVIAGDLHDTKANIRGECVSAMLLTLEQCRFYPIILRGNHDSLNEKSSVHAIQSLKYVSRLVSEPSNRLNPKIGYMIPYQHDPEVLKTYLKTIPKGSRLIMHQGVENSSSGHYIQDKSALPKECFKDFRVISGHYHTRQDIDCGPGVFSYIGNPYTLGFGEANDPEKGFQVLYDDGNLVFVPTGLRRHRILEVRANKEGLAGTVDTFAGNASDDIVLVRLSGQSDVLASITKERVRQELDLPQHFRLDLIPDEISTTRVEVSNDTPQDQMLDDLIDSMQNVDEDCKTRIKSLAMFLRLSFENN